MKIKEEFYKVKNSFKYKINDLMALYEIKISQIKSVLNKENKMNLQLINYRNHDNYTSNTNINGNLNSNVNLIDGRYVTTNNIKYYRNRNDNISHSSLSFKIKEPISKINNVMNTSLFNNGASSINEYMSYQDKKCENEKLKTEIERYKNEISMLIKEINGQQKQISDIQKIKKLWEQIPKSIYNKIKNLISFSCSLFTFSLSINI